MAQERNPEGLLARVAARDGEALAELYDQLAPNLLGMLLQILNDRQAAEEVLQRVFAQLWTEARRAGHSSVSLAVWLTLLARRIAVEQLRAMRNQPPLDSNSLGRLEESVCWLPDPAEIARLDQRRELLRKVLNELPKQQRQALDLAVFGGYTTKEISEQLGEPLARVKTELRAAMTFVRHRLRALSGTWAANI